MQSKLFQRQLIIFFNRPNQKRDQSGEEACLSNYLIT